MKKIFSIIIVLLLTITINVYAEDTNTVVLNDGDTQTFSYEQYNYTIQRVLLNVYRFIKVDGETNEDSINDYLSDDPYDVIELPETSYTLNPTYKAGKWEENDLNMLFVDLGLDIEKETLEELLEEYIDTADEQISYMVDVAVEYKINNKPDSFNYLYKVNTIKELMHDLYGNNENETTPDDYLIDFDDVNSQVINVFLIQYLDGLVDTTYSRGTSDGFFDDWYYLNFQLLSPNKIISDDDSFSNAIGLMFHDLDDIDAYIERLNSSAYGSGDFGDDDDDEFNLPDDMNNIITNDPEIVKVDNTAKNSSRLIYLICMILFTIGFGLIFYYLYQKEKINKSQV